MKGKPVVTRIAPSPTGEMHIGTVRTALFSYLFAKHHGGTYFVRIEDTDKARSKSEWTELLLKDFEWCGLRPDKVYIQSEHQERHKELLQALVEKGVAYVSEEPSKESPEKKVSVVRLKNPGKQVIFNDLIRGEVTFDTSELGDFVIARSLEDPLYHFAVVVDDHDAGVSHVIRAEEHISNTPRQILIHEALGFEHPEYAHIPLILAKDRSKLSKRRDGATVGQYRDQGFIPEGVINYLALLGWNPATDEEFFTIPELIERFTLDQVQKSGAIFDEQKMRWFNREHILKMDSERFKRYVQDFMSADTYSALEKNDRLNQLIPVIRERIEVFGDVKKMEESGEFSYFIETPSYEPKGLLWKKEPSESETKRLLSETAEILEKVSAWDADSVKEALWDFAEKEGKGNVLWPLRFALTGHEKSPDPFTVAGILGKHESLERIGHAVSLLS